MKGDVIDARNLDSMLLGVSNPSEKDEDLVGDCSKGRPGESLFMEQHIWTSLQHSEAKSIFKAIMSESSAKKCGNCGAKNPKIVSPGFGLLYKVPGRHLDTCWAVSSCLVLYSLLLSDYIFS